MAEYNNRKHKKTFGLSIIYKMKFQITMILITVQNNKI